MLPSFMAKVFAFIDSVWTWSPNEVKPPNGIPDALRWPIRPQCVAQLKSKNYKQFFHRNAEFDELSRYIFHKKPASLNFACDDFVRLKPDSLEVMELCQGRSWCHKETWQSFLGGLHP